MKKAIIFLAGSLLVIGTSLGVAYAAFKDQSKFMGSSFSVGSADIKLLKELDGGTASSNLTDTKEAPSFTNISPNWSQDYLLKIYNNATTTLKITSNADYLTANDPDNLRDIIFVEPFPWNDANNNGLVDADELGTSYGKKTIVKWKTEGFDLGNALTGEVRGLVLRFSTASVADSKQGKTGVWDFIFVATGL
jgi:hypothetical protein